MYCNLVNFLFTDIRKLISKLKSKLCNALEACQWKPKQTPVDFPLVCYNFTFEFRRWIWSHIKGKYGSSLIHSYSLHAHTPLLQGYHSAAVFVLDTDKWEKAMKPNASPCFSVDIYTQFSSPRLHPRPQQFASVMTQIATFSIQAPFDHLISPKFLSGKSERSNFLK